MAQRRIEHRTTDAAARRSRFTIRNGGVMAAFHRFVIPKRSEAGAPAGDGVALAGWAAARGDLLRHPVFTPASAKTLSSLKGALTSANINPALKGGAITVASPTLSLEPARAPVPAHRCRRNAAEQARTLRSGMTMHNKIYAAPLEAQGRRLNTASTAGPLAPRPQPAAGTLLPAGARTAPANRRTRCARSAHPASRNTLR